MNKTDPEQEYKIYRACFLHYMERHSQREVAKRMGVNQGTVSRWLTTALHRDWFHIDLRPPSVESMATGLCQQFGLRPELVRVVAGHPSADAPIADLLSEYRDLGYICAPMVAALIAARMQAAEQLRPGAIGIGFGSGRGVAAFVRAFAEFCPPTNLDLYALAMHQWEDARTCASTVTFVAENLLDVHFGEIGEPQQVAGHGHRTTRDGVISDAEIEQLFAEAENCVDVIVTGIGTLEDCWFVTPQEQDKLRAAGVGGDFLNQLFCDGGRAWTEPTNKRVQPFGFERLNNMLSRPNATDLVVIARDKADALYAVLDTPPDKRLVTGVVTFESVAQDLLSRKERESTTRE